MQVRSCASAAPLQRSVRCNCVFAGSLKPGCSKHAAQQTRGMLKSWCCWRTCLGRTERAGRDAPLTLGGLVPAHVQVQHANARPAAQDPYLWKLAPMPCDPAALPKYDASHELDMKKKRHAEREQRQAQVPAPEATLRVFAPGLRARRRCPPHALRHGRHCPRAACVTSGTAGVSQEGLRSAFRSPPSGCWVGGGVWGASVHKSQRVLDWR